MGALRPPSLVFGMGTSAGSVYRAALASTARCLGRRRIAPGRVAVGGDRARATPTYIRPNIASALLVQATVSIPAAIIAEAILSFLGLGVQPPTPSWGTMLNAAQQFLESAPWMAWWAARLARPAG